MLSREERHALAARLRLGEVIKGRLIPFRNDYRDVYALETLVYHVNNGGILEWEDGTTSGIVGSQMSQVLAYLERD